MILRWHGHACFELQSNFTLVIDPHDGRSIATRSAFLMVTRALPASISATSRIAASRRIMAVERRRVIKLASVADAIDRVAAPHPLRYRDADVRACGGALDHLMLNLH